MTTGLLIITHDDVGKALIHSASAMLGVCPLVMEMVPVLAGMEPDAVVDAAREAIERLDQGAGVLVLTDMYGSTPSNIANRLASAGRVMIVAGVNLPMLIRVMNYPELSLPELARKAVSGGRDGIFVCEPE